MSTDEIEISSVNLKFKKFRSGGSRNRSISDPKRLRPFHLRLDRFWDWIGIGSRNHSY